MSVQRKAVPVEFKVLDEDQGVVEAIVSVFGNVDLGGDRVDQKAFDNSLERWRQSGAMIPVIWSHDWSDLWSHIGYADPKDVAPTETGLKARYHLDISDNPAAAQAFRLMKRRTIKEHSFAYQVVKEKMAKDGVNDLLELDLIEIGPTLKGMNPDTELLAVKSALEEVTAKHAAAQQDKAGGSDGEKAGRTLSKANEAKLRSAMDSIAQVLSSLGPSEDDEGDPEKSKDEAEAGKASDAEASKASDLEYLSFNQAISMIKEWNSGSVR